MWRREGACRGEPRNGRRQTTVYSENLIILYTYLPMKTEQSVPKLRHIKFRCRGNYPEESIRHSEHGGSLKSRTYFLLQQILCRLQYYITFIFNGYRGSLSGLKWSGHKAEHSPPPTAEIKNEWSYTSAPLVCHHGAYGDGFTLLIDRLFSAMVKDWDI